jgi:YrbI family 3-deoxy-D-manno-octulosonate 8-phosphate phosphatase
VFKPWVLREHDNRLGGKIALYPMHPLDSFQVDEPGDLDWIAHLMRVRTPQPVVAHLADIRLLVLDFDGVLTDNRVLVDQEGKEAVWCHRGDGWGIARLKEAGVDVMVISTEQNPVVAARCRKLDIPCIHGCNDKLSALQAVAREKTLGPERIAFVGNDVNDLECLRWVAFPFVVADAMPEVQAAACLITRRPGGAGAVREVCDSILSQKKAGHYA